MRTRVNTVCPLCMWALLSAVTVPARAHRLDEYLQATTISVEQGRVGAQMRLTPGVAVFPTVFAGMDANRDGVLSNAEQRAYAERVLGDLSLVVDGERLRSRLLSWQFAPTAEMKEGRGEIEIAFAAEVPPSARSRTLVFENHHQSKIAVYLVNCLVPSDPAMQVTAQRRNYGQSRYELDYVQGGAPDPAAIGQPSILARRQNARVWLGIIAFVLSAPLLWLWRRRVGIGAYSSKQTGGVPVRSTARKENGGV